MEHCFQSQGSVLPGLSSFPSNDTSQVTRLDSRKWEVRGGTGGDLHFLPVPLCFSQVKWEESLESGQLLPDSVLLPEDF